MCWSSDVCSSDLTQPGVLPNRVHAQLCEYGDDAEQGSAHRGRGVDHRFGEALDVDALVLQFVQRLDQDALGPAEPIEAAHQQHVAGAEVVHARDPLRARSEERTSELQSLMRNSYAVFCLKKKKKSH